MGRGRSKGSGGGGGAAKAAAPKTTAPAAPPQPKQPRWKTGANTPAGITYDEYMKLSYDQKIRVTHDILNDPNIKVPAYLDGSDTTKFLYATGMNKKPTVVTDAQLDKRSGTELFRTVYETRGSSIKSDDILNQVKTGDYTHMSGSGGSVHGRAIYFADSYGSSAVYGHGKQNPKMMRAKLNSNAKIVDERTLRSLANNSKSFSRNPDDNLALYALANGYDGWKASNGYHMIVNRGALTVSKTNKKVTFSKRSWK